MKKTKILSICIIAIMLLVAICPIVSNADTTATITFKDKILAEWMENIVKAKADENAKLNGLTLTTTQEAIDSITLIQLNTNTAAEESGKIEDLTGLEKFTNLKSLWIRGNKISDLAPISNLTKLEELYISNNNISDLKALSKLTSLKKLEAYSCNLTTLEGVESLTNLEDLDVENLVPKNYSNKITDITPIRNLTKLVKFDISNNNIEYTNYSGNKISDLSALAGRTGMTDLRFSNNEVTDMSIISNMKNLEYLFADGNYIENIPEDVLDREFKTFNMWNETIVKQVKLSEYNTNEITLDLPQIFILAKQNKLITTNEAFSVENAKLSEDSTKVILTKESIEKGNNSVKLGNGNANGTTVTYVLAFEVLDVKKEPDTENADKVKVTITVNKELDPTKIPDGWTLSEDKKSISKEFDKNGKEDVTLTDKDGDTIKQTVEVSNIKDGNGDDKEEFKVINKTEEDQGNGKIKVTVTVNKELDPTKLPDGWTLSEDGKSIWKVMDKGASEDLTLVAKDGSTIKYTVTAGDKTTAPGKIPQTGVKNTIIVVVAGIAIVGTVVFIRSRKMLK